VETSALGIAKILSVVLVGIGISLLSTPSAFAQAQGRWASTHTYAHSPRSATFVGALANSAPVNVVVGLQMRNSEAMSQEILALRHSAGLKRPLTPVVVLERYGPTEAQAQQVASYLINAGFTDVQIAPNRLLVTATGTAAAARGAFNTELAVYSRNGRQGIVNTKDASVPAELASIVLSVLGLQTLDHLQPVSGSLQVVSPSTQLANVYDASSMSAATGTVVGIITEGSMTQTQTDLSDFESAYSLPTITTSVVQTGSGPWTDTNGTGEWDLDSQTIQSVAHNVKEMIFYDATGTSTSGFTDAEFATAVNVAVTDNVAKVISVSLGECESDAYNDGTMATVDESFASAILQGQTFSVASGDHGAYSCGTLGENGTYGTELGDSYPASSPYVVAVGGTSLYTNESGGTYSYASESAWAYGGGGPSAYESQPAWQKGVVSGSYRGVPDIAFDANPSSGIYIYVDGSLISTSVGGTSLAAPIFAGAWARIESANNNVFGFAAPWLYHAAQVSSSVFHDVTTGQNGSGTCPGIDYCAAVGWDYTTGWGSIDVAKLNTALKKQLAAALAAIDLLLLQ
jgi:pseudomonalisin